MTIPATDIEIARLDEVLTDAGYPNIPTGDHAYRVYDSPYTRRPIVVPLDIGESLPLAFVDHLLSKEPSRARLVALMRN